MGGYFPLIIKSNIFNSLFLCPVCSFKRHSTTPANYSGCPPPSSSSTLIHLPTWGIISSEFSDIAKRKGDSHRKLLLLLLLPPLNYIASMGRPASLGVVESVEETKVLWSSQQSIAIIMDTNAISGKVKSFSNKRNRETFRNSCQVNLHNNNENSNYLFSKYAPALHFSCIRTKLK